MDMTILTANEKQALLTATDQEIQEYLRRREKGEWDRISRFNSAMRKGEQKGAKKEALKIAKNLLVKGSSLEFVHEITGLDIDKLNRLQTRL